MNIQDTSRVNYLSASDVNATDVLCSGLPASNLRRFVSYGFVCANQTDSADRSCLLALLPHSLRETIDIGFQ